MDRGLMEQYAIEQARQFKIRSNESNSKTSPQKQQDGDRVIQCIPCQRLGRKAQSFHYCQDCDVGLCDTCKQEHVLESSTFGHNITLITRRPENVQVLQAYPELREIGALKLEGPCTTSGSAFMPGGELVVADRTSARVRVFSADYTRKQVTTLLVPKQGKWNGLRPKPLRITAIGLKELAFTVDSGCLFIAAIGSSMIMRIVKVIDVSKFESSICECLGLAFNDQDDGIYVGYISESQDYAIKVYEQNGSLRHEASENVQRIPAALSFGLDKNVVHVADHESVLVYRSPNFNVIERHRNLPRNIRDLVLDKWGYIYILTTDERGRKVRGKIFRMDMASNLVTKLQSFRDMPTSIAYCPKTDTIAVTFMSSAFVALFDLKLNSLKK